jgi:hypothetical protein
MPYYFSFYDDNARRLFYAKMKTRQCTGHNKNNGHRCRRRCTIGFEFCPTHLESQMQLKVKDSSIENAGKGLFAHNSRKDENETIFRKGDKITSYNGEFIDKEILLERYDVHTAPYGIQYSQDEYIDSALLRGVGSLINHAPVKDTNVRFSVDRRNHEINLVATRHVKNGDELLVNYGRDYHFDDNYKVRPYPTKS